MTREAHLEFCRRCLNRKFVPTIRIVCSLTDEVSSFERFSAAKNTAAEEDMEMGGSQNSLSQQ